MIECVETVYQRLKLRAKGKDKLVDVPMAFREVAQWNARQEGAAAAGLVPHVVEFPIRTTLEHLAIPCVSHGEWRVECPYCHDAQLLSLTDPRFVCCNRKCQGGGAAGADGAAMAVPLPDALILMRIEAALELRPKVENRNWLPGETVADLVRENRENGVPVKALQRVIERASECWAEVKRFPAADVAAMAQDPAAWYHED